MVFQCCRRWKVPYIWYMVANRNWRFHGISSFLYIIIMKWNEAYQILSFFQYIRLVTDSLSFLDEMVTHYNAFVSCWINTTVYVRTLLELSSLLLFFVLQITPMPGAWPQKPGSATLPFFGVQVTYNRTHATFYRDYNTSTMM